MQTPILLPELPGDTARIERWLRAPGDTITSGEPIVIVVTTRVEAAIPAPIAGTLSDITVPAATTAATGTVLAHLTPSGERPDRPGERPLRATPVARAIAAQAGIDLTQVHASGPDGRIRKSDLQALPATAPAQRAAPLITAVTSASDLSAVPRGLAVMHADMSAVVAFCSAHGADFAGRGLELTELACIVQAIAAIFPAHPLLNASWHSDGIVVRRRLHIEASGSERHRCVIADAADLNVRGIARALAEAPPGDNLAATFGLSMVARPDGWRSTAMPGGHSAALACGAVTHQAVVCDDAVGVRPLMWLALTYDARVLLPAQADAFLRDLCRRLADFQA